MLLCVETLGRDGPGGGIRHDAALQQDSVPAGERTSTKQCRTQVETQGREHEGQGWNFDQLPLQSSSFGSQNSHVTSVMFEASSPV